MSKKNLILLSFIILKFLLQYFFIDPAYDLQRDEYLHLDQGHHLAWGYESVPPFTSWISWIIFQLGNAVSWVKFFPALFGALTILLVWKITELLNGNLFASVMVATATTFSVLLRINILYQPNSFDILSWTFVYYTIACYIKTENPGWMYAAAMGFAIGFLNKYNIVFLLAGLLPAFLITRQRSLLFNRHVFFAIILSLLLISPNLIWQYHNNFPVIRHMKELSETQLVHVRQSDFLKGQLLFFFNSVYIILIAFAGFFIYPPFKKYRLFSWSFLITLLIFLCLKAKDYYAIGLYPFMLAFGSVYLEGLTRKGRRYWLRPICLVFSLVIFLPAVKIMLPVQSPEEIMKNSKGDTYRWEDGKEHPLQQDFADMIGWRELAAKTDNIYQLLADKEHTIVLCANYGEAGAINYYTRQKIQAVSLNADYLNWFDTGRQIRSIILVKDDPDEGTAHERSLFENVTLAGIIENKFAREKDTQIFILTKPKMDINKIISDEISKAKSR